MQPMTHTVILATAGTFVASAFGFGAPDPASGTLIMASGQDAPGVNGALVDGGFSGGFVTNTPASFLGSFDNESDFVFLAGLQSGSSTISPASNIALYHWDVTGGARFIARNGCDPCGFCRGAPAGNVRNLIALPGDLTRFSLSSNPFKGHTDNAAFAIWRDGVLSASCWGGTVYAPPVDSPGGVIMETEDMYVETRSGNTHANRDTLSFLSSVGGGRVLQANTRPPGMSIKLAQSPLGTGGETIWADLSVGADGSGVVTTEFFQNAFNGVTDVNKWIVITLDGTDVNLRLRGGDEIDGLPGFVYRGERTNVEMISSGRFLIETPLAPVDDPNGVFDAIVEISGDSAEILYRVGDPAPLIAGSTIASVDLLSRNRFGDYTFAATLAPSPGVTADNDEVLYLVRSGVPTVLLRESSAPRGLSSPVVALPDEVMNPNLYGDLPIEVDGRWLAFDGVQGVFFDLSETLGTVTPLIPGAVATEARVQIVTRVNDHRDAVARYRYVGPDGSNMELRVFSFAGPPPCSPADLSSRFGMLDLDDVDAFLNAFLASEPAADLVEPFGVIDLADTDAFIAAFLAGCP